MDSEQALYIARNTTPQERLEWIEEMMDLFAPQLLAQREREQIELLRVWNKDK